MVLFKLSPFHQLELQLPQEESFLGQCEVHRGAPGRSVNEKINCRNIFHNHSGSFLLAKIYLHASKLR